MPRLGRAMVSDFGFWRASLFWGTETLLSVILLQVSKCENEISEEIGNLLLYVSICLYCFVPIYYLVAQVSWFVFVSLID